MNLIRRSFIRLCNTGRKAQTSVEYTVLAALLAVGMIVAVTFFRDELVGMFENFVNRFRDAQTG